MRPWSLRQRAAVGSGRLLGSVWDAVRRHLAGARVGAADVRRVLLEQAGVATIDSVCLVPGPTGRRQLMVRIHIAEGYDAREVICQATEALIRDPSVTEILVLASAGDDSQAAR